MACAHRGCACVETPVERDEKAYCSERCARIEASGKHEAHCPCGHEECAQAPKP